MALHWAAVPAELKRAFVQVVLDLSHAGPTELWRTLRENGLCYLSLCGRPIHESELPRHIGSLVDDPYRSISWLARVRSQLEGGPGYLKVAIGFMEFTWADYLRRSRWFVAVESGIRSGRAAAAAGGAEAGAAAAGAAVMSDGEALPSTSSPAPPAAGSPKSLLGGFEELQCVQDLACLACRLSVARDLPGHIPLHGPDDAAERVLDSLVPVVIEKVLSFAQPKAQL